MKKIGIIACVLCNFITCGTETPFSQQKFESYVRKWGGHEIVSCEDEPEGQVFKTQIFKDKLLNEIDDDQHAIKSFNLFQQHDLLGFTDYCITNLSNMFPDNSDKFKDLLFTAAPIINFKEGSKSQVQRIVDMAGGARNVYDYTPQFPQFCYEMVFCMMIDTDWPGELHDYDLSKACEAVCVQLTDTCNWGDLFEEERSLRLLVDIRDDDESEADDCIWDFKDQWCPEEDSKKNSNDDL